LLRAALLFGLVLVSFLCAAAQPPTIAVLDFEIEDDTVAQGGVSDTAAQERRLQMVAGILRRDLAQGDQLRVADNMPVTELMARTRALQPLHECNGCEIEIARALDADLVLVGWVQKVSNLILNVNAGVKDVRTGRTLLIRSVDMRGNNDASWERAARRLAQEVRETLPARVQTQAAPR
jgi:hypothetical protein